MPSHQQARLKQQLKSARPETESYDFLLRGEERVLANDDSNGGESDNDPAGKDETEERLEKLLFGDTAGFHDALKGCESSITDPALRKSPGAEGGAEDKLEDAEGVEDAEDAMGSVDDADVCVLFFVYPTFFRVEIRISLANYFSEALAFFSRRWDGRCRWCICPYIAKSDGWREGCLRTSCSPCRLGRQRR